MDMKTPKDPPDWAAVLPIYNDLELNYGINKN